MGYETGSPQRLDGSPSTALRSILVSPILHEPRHIQEPRATGLSYETFYGLKEKPFSLSSDARFFYHSRAHAPAYEDLLGRHPPPREPQRPDRRHRHGQDHVVPRRPPGPRSQDVQRVRAGSVRLARRPAQGRPHGLRRAVGGRSHQRPLEGRLAHRAQLPALRVPRHAHAAPGLRGGDHRRGAEPFGAAARRDPDPVGLRRPRAAAAGRARRTARAARQTEAARDAPGRPAHLRALQPRAARRARVAGYIAHRLEIAGGSPDRVRFSQEAVEALYRRPAACRG